MVHWKSPARSRWIDRALLGFALLFGLALIVAKSVCGSPPLAIWDRFDPDLQSIQSVNAAAAYVRGTRSSANSLATADATDAFVRKRFTHGYSEFAPCENWLAYLASYVRYDLRNPVLPNDILKHRRAACSQQAIVFQSVARQLGLDVGSVRLTGHFLSAVRIGDRWMVYDADREIEPSSYQLASLLEGDPRIEQTYGAFGRQLDMIGQAKTGQIRFGDVDRNPAAQASFFHWVTHFFSEYGWAVFLGLFFARHAVRALLHDWRRRSRMAGSSRETKETVDVQHGKAIIGS
jgi:hypothetical protein